MSIKDDTVTRWIWNDSNSIVNVIHKAVWDDSICSSFYHFSTFECNPLRWRCWQQDNWNKNKEAPMLEGAEVLWQIWWLTFFDKLFLHCLLSLNKIETWFLLFQAVNHQSGWSEGAFVILQMTNDVMALSK